MTEKQPGKFSFSADQLTARPESSTSCYRRESFAYDPFTGLSEDEANILKEFASRHKPSPLMDALGLDYIYTNGCEVHLEAVRLLLESGCDPNEVFYTEFGEIYLPLEVAACSRSLDAVNLLLAHGARADLVHDDPRQTSILDNIAHIYYWRKHPETMLKILEVLLDSGANPGHLPAQDLSALQTFWKDGNQEAADLMLKRGADESQLKMTPLLWVIHRRDPALAHDLAYSSEDLFFRDIRDENALEKAVRTAQLNIADDLLSVWGDLDEASAQRLFESALESDSVSAISWVLRLGFDHFSDLDLAVQRLEKAAERGRAESLAWLLNFKFDPGYAFKHLNKACQGVSDGKSAYALYMAGAANFDRSVRGQLINYVCPGPNSFRLATLEEFKSAKHPRWGKANPEDAGSHYYSARLLSRRDDSDSVDFEYLGYEAIEALREDQRPFWNEDRFGQTLTILPDGRVIEIGGEHEDSCSSDFCIYNEIFLSEPGQLPKVFLYPRDVFPPTDNHTATLVGDHIYIIGCLGYYRQRANKVITPVYRLNVNTLAIENVETSGEMPGWISKHQSKFMDDANIFVSGGQRVQGTKLVPSSGTYTLNFKTLVWKKMQD